MRHKIECAVRALVRSQPEVVYMYELSVRAQRVYDSEFTYPTATCALHEGDDELERYSRRLTYWQKNCDTEQLRLERSLAECIL